MVAEPEARDPREASGGPVALVFLLVSLVGLGVSLATGFLIVRGPFLGGATLPPVDLFVALGGFVAGIVTFSWGGAKSLGAGLGR
jgi:hypothetical protein